jgi:uncharacterized protein (TIGR02996 family)
MSHDDGFIRAIVENPEDRATRLIYADWLDERDDPRGEYLRIEEILGSRVSGDERTFPLRRRMIELRTQISPRWLELIGSYRNKGSDPDDRRIESAAGLLGRPVQYVDENGYQ